MRHHQLLSCALLLTMLACTAQAADGMKPGQWDVTMKMHMQNAPQIPPEQLAKMKEMGINMPMGGQPMQVQTCVTPEQASFEKAAPQQNKDCKTQNIKHVGNKVTGEMVCTGEMKATGKFEMTLNGDTSYEGKWSIKGVSKHGEPIDQSSETSGKWVKAVCDPSVAARSRPQ